MMNFLINKKKHMDNNNNNKIFFILDEVHSLFNHSNIYKIS